MSTEVGKQVALEIAHVSFIDIVGYSRLSINEQRVGVGISAIVLDRRA